MTNVNAPADWRTMEAGRKLDRLIAERLGLKLVNRWPVVTYWLDRAKADGGGVEKVVPAYSSDANAALTLPIGNMSWSLSYWPERPEPYLAALCGAETDGGEETIFGTTVAESYALAMCMSWLESQS